MKLSELENEEALDVLADILEPASEIISDENIKTEFQNGEYMKAAKAVIKGHKSSIIEILARLDNVPVAEYRCNFFTLPRKVFEILTDSELIDFFKSSADQAEENVSADAMEHTEATENQ